MRCKATGKRFKAGVCRLQYWVLCKCVTAVKEVVFSLYGYALYFTREIEQVNA